MNQFEEVLIAKPINVIAAWWRGVESFHAFSDGEAEDGPIDARYNLQETPSRTYSQRTEWNVRDSDGTVVFSIAPTVSGGSKKTILLAQKNGKPVIHISRCDTNDQTDALLEFVRANGIRVLNVAGPRGSKEPEVAAFTKTVWNAFL